MKLTRPRMIALTGISCVALLGTAYLMPTKPATPSGAADPNAGRGNASAPVDRVELAAVNGSETKYPTRIESTVGDKQVRLALTGTALRKKVIVNVYTIGSYVEEGVAVASADELCAKDCVKQLHLVMETSVSGKQMADAFTDAIRANYAKPKFDTEIAALGQKLRALDLDKGDQVWFTNIPGTGLRFDIVGKMTVSIENSGFAQAMWEIYLGKKNLGEQIKTNLTSRLK